GHGQVLPYARERTKPMRRDRNGTHTVRGCHSASSHGTTAGTDVAHTPPPHERRGISPRLDGCKAIFYSRRSFNGPKEGFRPTGTRNAAYPDPRLPLVGLSPRGAGTGAAHHPTASVNGTLEPPAESGAPGTQ